MSASSVFRDFRVLDVIAMAKRTATTKASGVIDTRTARGERMLVVLKKGQGSGAGAIKLKIYHSNTVSGTASGMTIIASNTSLTASALAAGANKQAWDIDLRKYGRFFGFLTSTGTASGISGVEVFVGDLKVSPPSATDDGYATWTALT